ncbi:MAG: hypothetical protein GVY05_08935 [Bacteroidetes bacterium]|jgi:hypothetical protein|nr:hypothetical protein [Bacteroidota bacterium]
MESEKNKKEKNGFLKSVTENLSEGTNFISGKVKDLTAKAYVAGSEALDDTSEKIHDYTEKQSLLKEKGDLEQQQEEMTQDFGDIALKYYLKEGNLHKPFFNKDEVNKLIESFTNNAKRIKALEKQIKKIENKK